jgi:hypothetical protein
MDESHREDIEDREGGAIEGAWVPAQAFSSVLTFIVFDLLSIDL